MKRFVLALGLPAAIRRNVSLPIAHSLIKHRASDRYLVSYPRSGSTWLRTILAGVMDPASGFDPDTFNRLLPGVSGRRLPAVWMLKSPRIIHSHTGFRRGLGKVVYVVRDGRDSLVSLYHYTTTRSGSDIPFDDWFELYCKCWYGPRWHDNVLGWLVKGKERLKENLLVIKFEDLKCNPVDRVCAVVKFLGMAGTEEQVVHGIEMAKIERAREREARVLGTIEDENMSFYRSGKTGQYKDYLVGSMEKRFVKMSASALRLAGYEY